MSKAWQAYAQHILDVIEKIDRIMARGDLTQDEVLYDASLCNLQTLSESTQQLPDIIKVHYPAIPWKQISGFRNIWCTTILATSMHRRCCPWCSSTFRL